MLMDRFFEWLFMVMFREVWAARKAEDARKAEANRLRDEAIARARAERDALDGRVYLRYSHAKGMWLESLSPRQRWLFNRALAAIGSPPLW
jgi:hypothetical protein